MSMNFLVRGKETVNTGHESRLSQDSANERPGKFSDISSFMTTEIPYLHKAIPGTQAHVDPGHIIYIKDTSAKDSRINDRIMVILFHNPPFAYTCLSFCKHSELGSEGLCNSHAPVYTDEDQHKDSQPVQAQQSNAMLPRLEIQLHQNSTLEQNIYLNLREHWNIEQEAQFIVLGHVEKKSFRGLMPKIEKLFSDSLRLASSDTFKENGNLSSSKQEESAGPERKNSKHKDKNSAARKNKRKGGDGRSR